MRITLPSWTSRVLAVSTLPEAGSISTLPAWTKVMGPAAWAEAARANVAASATPEIRFFTGSAPLDSEAAPRAGAILCGAARYGQGLAVKSTGFREIHTPFIPAKAGTQVFFVLPALTQTKTPGSPL